VVVPVPAPVAVAGVGAMGLARHVVVGAGVARVVVVLLRRHPA